MNPDQPARQAANQALITQDDLGTWLGYKQRAEIEKWLRSEGIWFSYGRAGRIVTTLAAIEEARVKRQDDFGDIQFADPEPDSEPDPRAARAHRRRRT